MGVRRFKNQDAHCLELSDCIVKLCRKLSKLRLVLFHKVACLHKQLHNEPVVQKLKIGKMGNGRQKRGTQIPYENKGEGFAEREYIVTFALTVTFCYISGIEW